MCRHDKTKQRSTILLRDSIGSKRLQPLQHRLDHLVSSSLSESQGRKIVNLNSQL